MSFPNHDKETAKLGVRVPCSTSNLGPGFDQLGLALGLYLEVELEGTLEGSAHDVRPDEASRANWPAEDRRLTVAFDALLAGTTLAARRFRFHVHSEIPLCRGLGSSGAATAAGLLLAAELLQRELGEHARPSKARIESLGLELEGHPDNVIASLHGGCTLGIVLPENRLRVLHPPLHDDLWFAVAWPSTTLETREARAAMPAALPLDDVVWSTRRLAMLLEGLRSADPELLLHGAQDRLHTPYRLPLIAGAQEALAAALKHGALFSAISGSGSGLIAAHSTEQGARQVAEVLRNELEKHHAWAEARVLRADREGPRLL